MLRFVELAAGAVSDTYRALVAWLGGVFAGLEGGPLDPRAWGALVWLGFALALVFALALLVRRGRRRGPRLPEMMISHGEVQLVGESTPERFAYPAALGAAEEPPARARHYLKLALSNLNPYPVQLIELAVRTRGSRLPVVAEAGAVVPPNGAVDVTADLFDLPGTAGVLELYLFSSRLRGRTFRLVAPLEWEPWAQRYRIRALDGRSELVTSLASQERRRGERQAFESARRRERRRELARAAVERAEGLKRQVDGYRQARAQRSRAAAEAAEAAVSRALGARNVRRSAVTGPHEVSVNHAQGAADPVQPPPAKEPQAAPRPEMRFPDEF